MFATNTRNFFDQPYKKEWTLMEEGLNIYSMDQYEFKSYSSLKYISIQVK